MTNPPSGPKAPALPPSTALAEVKADSIAVLCDKAERTPVERATIVAWLRRQRENIAKAAEVKPAKRAIAGATTPRSLDDMDL